MEKFQISNYDDIDWRKLWQNSREQKSWHSKGAEDWDKKAPSFAERVSQSPYIPLFLSRLPLQKTYSVIDVGCGPGTLALPLAEHVKSVTAIDYSVKMLDILQDQARQNSLSNIRCVHCAWESDWIKEGIEPADIAIASRSMNVADLSMAIDKLNVFANKYIFITDRIAPSPFDPEAFAAIGREFNSGPDYIFTLNILYKKGIHPNVEILELDKHVEFSSTDEAFQSYQWMFKELTSTETIKLKEYISSRIVSSTKDTIKLLRPHPPRWAMIWWKK